MIHYIGWIRSPREKPAVKNRGLFALLYVVALAITPAPFQVTGVFLFPTFPTKASYAQSMWGQDSQRRAMQESSLT